jgi:hypothetical protein
MTFTDLEIEQLERKKLLNNELRKQERAHAILWLQRRVLEIRGVKPKPVQPRPLTILEIMAVTWLKSMQRVSQPLKELQAALGDWEDNHATDSPFTWQQWKQLIAHFERRVK